MSLSEGKSRQVSQSSRSIEGVPEKTSSSFQVPIPPAVGSNRPIKFWQGVVWGFSFVMVPAVSAVLGATIAFMAPIQPSGQISNLPIVAAEPPSSLLDFWQSGFQYYVSRPVNILVVGVDRVLDTDPQSSEIFSGRTDTMLLLHIDPEKATVSVLSIPRDTRVSYPETGGDPEQTALAGEYDVIKVNEANVIGGPALTGRVISRMLNGVKIDRYVRVSTEAFRELVDLVGGVDIYVPTRMDYVDNTQKLKIDLYPGWQTLNGDQAEQFARFRHDAYGDIGRVQRQQALIKALRQRLTNPAILSRIPQMLRLMSRYLDTNITLEEMLALAHLGLKLDSSSFKMVMLPGRFSGPQEYAASYWIMNPEGRDRVMAQYFNLQPRQSTDGYGSEASAVPLKNIRIAVQNASSQPQQAQKVVDFLNAHGFKNVYLVEDWPTPLRQSAIVVQQGDLQAANQLQQILTFGRVEAESTGDLESDLTIRVGEDLQ